MKATLIPPRSICCSFVLRFAWGLVMLASFSASIAKAQSKSTEITPLPIPAWGDAKLSTTELPFFFSSGIPLAQGTIASVDQLVLRDAAQNSIPTQFTPLAYWPDGSIKWVSITPVVHGSHTLPFTLCQIDQAAAPKTIQIHTLPDQGVRVESDQITVEVSGKNAQFQWTDRATNRTITVDWQLERRQREALKITDSWLHPHDRRPEDSPAQFSLSHSVAEEITVEESGPVRAVIRVQGKFTSADGEAFNRYDYRLYVHAGTSTLRWQPSWIFDGNPETDFIGSLTASLQISGENPAQATTQVHRVDQDQEQVIQLSPGQSIVQDDAEQRLSGHLSVKTNRADLPPVQIAVKEFWQHYPSGFAVADDSIQVGLWPSQSAYVLDLARTSDGTGEGEGSRDSESNAVGVSKTFDLLFHGGIASETFQPSAEVLDQEPLFYPGSQYMVGTGVLGPIAPLDTQGFPRMEGLYQAGITWLALNREKFRWYGFIDYGDTRTDYVTDKQAWMNYGRYGWRQAAGDVPQAIMVQYFRSGDRTAWEFGAPYARHIMDVDTIHIQSSNNYQPVGSIHRRGQDHWSGDAQSQYTYSQGAYLYHYLSGDLRVRSVLVEDIAAWHSQKASSGSANAFNTTIRTWEATGDAKWRELAKQQLAPYLDGKNYDNFRFAFDYVPALSQYVWLTRDQEVLDEVSLRMDRLLDPEVWAHFHPDISPRGGRLMLPAIFRSLGGEVQKSVLYPARSLASRLPPAPPEEKPWTWESLRQWLPPGMTASLGIGEAGTGPYFIKALQDLNLTEADLENLSPMYGSQSMRGFKNDTVWSDDPPKHSWKMLPLTSGVSATDQENPELARRLQGLPYGAGFEVNQIPFYLPAAERENRAQWLRLQASDQIKIAIPKGAEALHLLGPMIEKGDWNEGSEVIRYTLHLKNGETQQGTWKNLTDHR